MIEKKKDILFLSILFLFKIYLFTTIDLSNIFIEPATNYALALKDHFLEYTIYYHIKPIGMILRDKTLLELFGATNIKFTALLLNSLLSGVSAFLVYLTFKKIKTPFILNFTVSLIYGLTLNAFDFWRAGNHYDHFNPFIVSLICYGTINAFLNWNFKALTLGLVLGIFFYAPTPLFVALLFFSLLFVGYQKKRPLLKLFISITIPTLVYIVHAGKNYYAHGIFTTSSLAGVTRIQYSKIATETPHDPNSFLRSSPRPKWWKACMEEAANIDWAAPIYGSCFRNSSQNIDFNFEKLLNNTDITSDNKINILIKDDINSRDKTPWIFSGLVPECMPKFAIEYGKVGAGIWKELILTHPDKFVYTFYKSFRIYLINGSKFFIGKKYEPQQMKLKMPILGRVIANLYIIIFISVFIFSILFFKNFKEHISDPIFSSIFTMISIFTISSSIQSAMICCENGRMFVSMSPMILICGIFSIIYLFNEFQKYRKIKF